MRDEKNSKNPATTSFAYDAMCSKWSLINTLLEGTAAMRAAGENYAPMHPDETTEGYRNRMAGAVLFNMVEQTLDTLSGKPFSAPIKLSEDIPEAVKSLFTDVDLQGNNIDVFGREWFRDGMANAFSHVLIDMPKPQAREDGTPRTLADDRQEGVRPYWTHISPQCLLFASSSIESGYEILQHVRIQEFYTEMNGFAEVERTQIRVLEPGSVKIYKPVPKKEDEWFLEDEWETGLGYIPLVTFYANKKGFMLGKPPLEDLAHLNTTHWQSTSDQRHILTVARFPILACDAPQDYSDEDVTIGPNKILYSAGKKYYLEHSGNAIEAGRKDLEDLERQMMGYGSEFLKKKTVAKTATERRLDSAEASSDLSAMCVVFEDAMMQVLDMTADWMQLGTSGGQVEVVKSFQVEETDPAIIEFMKYLREKNDLSREKLIAYAKLKGFLPEDFDVAGDWQQIVQEVSERSELLGSVFTDIDPEQEDEADDFVA